MRSLLVLLLVPPLWSAAQPSPPDISFVVAADTVPLQPIGRAVSVRLGCAGEIPGVRPAPCATYALQPLTTTDLPGWEHYVLNSLEGPQVSVTVRTAQDSMVLWFPASWEERWQLVLRVMQRSGGRPSPEVVRYRPGTFAFADVVRDPEAEQLAELLAEAMARRRQQEGRRQRMATLVPRPADR